MKGSGNIPTRPIIRTVVPQSKEGSTPKTSSLAHVLAEPPQPSKPLSTPSIKIIARDQNQSIKITVGPPVRVVQHKAPVPMPQIGPLIIQQRPEGGIRCVCGENRTVKSLVKCEKCEMRLHGLCINVAREIPGLPYWCPYCTNQTISCVCRENKKYSDPLIQCEKCKKWVHKVCYSLEFGRNPPFFLCNNCGTNNFKFPLVQFDSLDSQIPERTITLDTVDRTKIIENIPEGAFKSMMISDFQSSELSFRLTISSYFNRFVHAFFEGVKEFWKTFTETMVAIFQCDRQLVFDALDCLGVKFIYARETFQIENRNPPNGHSESIDDYLEKAPLTRYESLTQEVPLKLLNGSVYVEQTVEDKQIILLLPGFILHTDEVRCETGVPKEMLLVTDDCCLVDLRDSGFKLIRSFRRGFHFNCIVKMIRLKGEVRACLVATKLSGPIPDDKLKKGIAIASGGELVLPFDGGIPYPVQKLEWKDKKTKAKATREPVLKQKKTKKSKEKESNKAEFQNMSLFSLFDSDAVPPIPFVVLDSAVSPNALRVMKSSRSRLRPNAQRKLAFDSD